MDNMVMAAIIAGLTTIGNGVISSITQIQIKRLERQAGETSRTNKTNTTGESGGHNKLIYVTIFSIIVSAIAFSYLGYSLLIPQKLVSCGGCGVMLISPGDIRVAQSQEVTGSFKEIPDGYSIWIFTADQGKAYYPKVKANLNMERKTWGAKVNYLGEPQSSVHIKILLVGKNGEALISLHKEAEARNAIVPITLLTDDMLECDTRQITIN